MSSRVNSFCWAAGAAVTSTIVDAASNPSRNSLVTMGSSIVTAMPSLTFLGAAGTVTGSKHLLDLDGRKILDRLRTVSGPQGAASAELGGVSRSTPSKLDAVVLTHAHLDHCGYLPRLVAQGYRGRIFCTPGTRDLCTLVLPDSAHIQEEDARNANRHGYSKHAPALPLYTSLDAARTLTLLAAGGLRPADPDRTRRRGRVRQRRSSAGIGVRAPSCRRQDDPVRRRSRTLRPAGASRSAAD